MNQSLAYTIAKNGDATVYVSYKPFHVNASAPHYETVVGVLKDSSLHEDEKISLLESILNVKNSIVKHLGGFIKIVDNELFYKDLPVNNTLSDRIVEFFRKGYPVDNLVRFFERLQKNPSVRAQNELFNFLERNGLFITDDGYFLGYKGVDSNYFDKWSGTFDNKIGEIVTMPRERVDPNENAHCSVGLHVGTFEYASRYAGGGRLMLVKVDPADCVSVPNDGCEKLRTCRYQVIADVTGENVITETFVPEDKVSMVPPTKVTPLKDTTKSMPQRDATGRFLPKSGGVPSVASGSNILPKRDQFGRFLKGDGSAPTTKPKLPQRDAKGHFLPKAK